MSVIIPTTTVPDQSCPWCSFFHPGRVCPQATAIEYYPDGRVKRIELGSRQRGGDEPAMRPLKRHSSGNWCYDIDGITIVMP